MLAGKYELVRLIIGDNSATLLDIHRNSLGAAVAVVTEESINQGDRSKWQDNLAVIIGILSVAVIAIRLLGVSRGDPAIAYAVLQDGGTGNILIGTLVSTLGLLAIPAFAALLFYAIRVEEKHTLPRHVLLTVAAGVLYIAIYAAPVASFALGALEAIVVVFLLLFVSAWRDKAKSKTVLSVCICIYIGLVAIYEIASPTPWLPVQAISLAGQRPFSGYVLSQADGKTFILTSNPDGVISVRSQSVQSATQCIPHLYVEEQATLVYLFEHWRRKLANYPSCPTVRYSQSGQVNILPSSSSMPSAAWYASITVARRPLYRSRYTCLPW